MITEPCLKVIANSSGCHVAYLPKKLAVEPHAGYYADRTYQVIIDLRGTDIMKDWREMSYRNAR